MSENEKFSFKKLLASPFTKLFWVKALMYGSGLCVVAAIGYTFYKAYFIKPPSSQIIHAETGSNVTVIQKQVRKRFFIPFIEIYVQQPSNDDFQTGIRAGLRFEF